MTHSIPKIETNPELLASYARSLKGTDCPPLGICKPQNIKELQDILAFAREEQLAIYPICTGKNWGYGSAQASTKGQLIIDLSEMNQILEVNDKLAYARIQPAVTQAQLSDYLLKHNSRLQLDVTGAPKDTSLMGNFLERGFGHTDYGNRAEHIIELKVLLASGELISTGFSAFSTEQENTSFLYKNGIGPNLVGLFAQSNLGIVVEMTFELKVRPAHFCMFGLFCQNEEDLAKIVDCLREARLAGIVNSAVHIANQARAVGDAKQKSLGHWIVTAAISAEKPIVMARKRVLKQLLKKQLKTAYKLVFFNDRKIRLLEWLHKYIRPLPIIEGIRTTRDLQKGFPTNQPTQILLTNSAQKLPEHAEEFDAYFLWINAVCNADGKEVQRLKTLVKNFVEAAGQEFRVTFTAISPRSLIMISDIKYQKTAAEVKKAEQFYQDCMQMLIKEGFLPYRSGSNSYKTYAPFLKKPQLKLLKNLKTTLDPSRVIAPEKYNM